MVLVAGSAGFLGTAVLRAALEAGRDITALLHSTPAAVESSRTIKCDLSDRNQVAAIVAEAQPDWVVNCAALANVDECERDPARAHRLNAEIPANLAFACAEHGARLVHISTDSVFDGTRGMYSEDDIPHPLNVYAASKLAGEHEVAQLLPDALIVRTNFVGLANDRSAGLAGWIAASLEANKPINGFTDVIFSPLLADTLADIVFSMMDHSMGGVYHLSARDAISKYDFAVELADCLGVQSPAIAGARLADASLAAPRPLNTSLCPTRAEGVLGFDMPVATDAIAGFADRWRGQVAAA
ncbi:MAG: SDR family oxidoreductase [Gemmatimonadaceae bacterium]